MPHFSEEQLDEIAAAFGLKREETRPVRDGLVTKSTKVWWRGASGPELVEAGSVSHWDNIRRYPGVYQLKEPRTKVTYLDD